MAGVDRKFVADFLDVNNPILLPVPSISTSGRVIAPARKTDTKSSSRQLTFGKRTLTSQIDRKDSNYGFDFRTLRIEDLETLGSGTTQERSGGRGRGQPQASTSRNTGSNPAGRQAGATGRAPITQLGGSTRRPGSTRLGTAPSGLPEDTVERPSTARFSMSDPQELSKTRTSGKKALVPPALSFAFRAQGHAPVIEPSTIGGPGPGHYSCKYTLRERRVMDTRMDLMGAPPAGRFTMNMRPDHQPLASRSPRQDARARTTGTGTLGMDGVVRFSLEHEGAPAEDRGGSQEGEGEAMSGGQDPVPPVALDKLADNPASPVVSPSSPSKGLTFKPARATSPTQQDFHGTISFIAPPRGDPTEMALRSSAATHLAPYDIDESLKMTRRRTAGQIADFERMISRQTAQKAYPTGTEAPPVGTYAPSQIESFSAWRQARISIPRAAGSPVVALTRAGIRRAFATDAAGSVLGVPPKELGISAPVGALASEEAQWFLEGGVYRRRRMAPGRIEKGVLRTLQQMLVHRERGHLEAAAMQAEILAPDHIHTPDVPTPIPEEGEMEEAVDDGAGSEFPSEGLAPEEMPEGPVPVDETEEVQAPASEASAPDDGASPEEEEERIQFSVPITVPASSPMAGLEDSETGEHDQGLEATVFEAAFPTNIPTPAQKSLPRMGGGNRSPAGQSSRSLRGAAPTAMVDVTFPTLDVSQAQAPLHLDVSRLRNAGCPDDRTDEPGRLTLKRSTASGASSFAAGTYESAEPAFRIRTGAASDASQRPLAQHYAHVSHTGKFIQEPLDLRDNLFPKALRVASRSPPRSSDRRGLSVASRPSLRLTKEERKEMAVVAGPIFSHVKIIYSDPLIPIMSETSGLSGTDQLDLSEAGVRE